MLFSPFNLQLSLWINEKMLTAQDMSYDEARNLHSKWLKHQAFMAELQSNKEWLEKIDKVGTVDPGAAGDPGTVSGSVGPPPLNCACSSSRTVRR